jgi:crotonobetainyl-CoA:carnitine CoA-transferase CaiB-like acyl-CoA transferase
MPLEGLRVIDLTRALSGPFCSMILADLGADIVKIEPLPDGEMSRAWGRDVLIEYGIAPERIEALAAAGVVQQHP